MLAEGEGSLKSWWRFADPHRHHACLFLGVGQLHHPWAKIPTHMTDAHISSCLRFEIKPCINNTSRNPWGEQILRYCSGQWLLSSSWVLGSSSTAIVARLVSAKRHPS